jgi:8-oxo-dGTP diphosphatase
MTVAAKFCPRCGAPLAAHPPTRCPSCAYSLYVNARPTGSVIIVQKGHFLALRRARDPRRCWWDLPGGFCDGWEHPADTAIREAREELAVEVRLDDFVGMYVGSYDHQGETLPVLDSFWLATIGTGEIHLDATEATEYAWLPLNDPPQLAFDAMNRAISRVVSGLERQPGGN